MSDIFSFGCCLYNVMTLRMPFQGRDVATQKLLVIEGKPPQLPGTYPAELKALVLQMLRPSPSERPSPLQILQLPLLRESLLKLQRSYSQLNYPEAAQQIQELLKDGVE